jgi:hypothetical protein
MRFGALAALAAFLLPLPMMADTTYYYTGSDYTTVSGVFTTSDSLNGWFTVASPLGANLGTPGALATITPLSYSFTDGVVEYNDTNGTFELVAISTGQTYVPDPSALGDHFELSTDANGNIDAWAMYAGIDVDAGTAFYTESAAGEIPLHVTAMDGSFIAGNQGSTSVVGAWSLTSSSATPEPSSIVLVLTGLSGLAGVARRKYLRV